MNLIIFCVLGILYVALVGLTLGNMRALDLKTKLVYLIIGTFVNLVVTFIVVNISKINIENKEAYVFIKNVDILIFGAINSILTIPTIGKYLNNTKMEILTKEKASKKIMMLFIIYIIVLIIEINYLKGLRV